MSILRPPFRRRCFLGLLALAAPAAQAQNIISFNFATQSGTGVTPDNQIGAAETAGAGVYNTANWNNLRSDWSGNGGAIPSPVIYNNGTTVSGLTIGYDSPNAWNNAIATTTGDQKLMRNYLDSSAGDSPYVTLSGVPYRKYDLVVYADGDGGSGTVLGPYTVRYNTNVAQAANLTEAAANLTQLVRSPVWLKETGNFGGTYTLVNTATSTTVAGAASGNYMVFPGLKGNITLDPTQTTGVSRAPLNGFQVVNWETHSAIPGADDATAKVALYSGAATQAANRTIGSLATSVGTGGDLTINPGVTLTLANGDLDVGDINHWVKGGGNLTSATNVLTINRDVSQGLSYATGATDAAINGANLVDNGINPLQVVKTGFGQLVMAGNQPYTGGTVVDQGSIQVGRGGAGPGTGTYTNLGTGSVTVNSGAALKMWQGTTVGHFYTYANPVTLNNGSINSEDGNYIFSGTMTLSGVGGTLRSKWNNKEIDVTGQITGSGALNLALNPGGSSTSLFTITNPANNFSGGLSIGSGITLRAAAGSLGTGIISGAGSLQQNSGAGTTVINQNNTLSGNVAISSGSVTVNNGKSLAFAGATKAGADSLVLSGGAQLEVSQWGAWGTTGAFGMLNYNDSYLRVDNGIIRLAATDSSNANRGITISAGGVTLQANSGVTWLMGAGGNTLHGSGSLTLDGAGTGTISTPVTTSGAVVKNGSGTWTLAGGNTYGGSTTVNQGTLAVDGGSGIADGSAVILANTAGAKLSVLASETVGSIAGGGASGGNIQLASGTLTAGGTGANTVYSGTISGPGNLNKAGSGTLTLNSTHTFTGTTTVSGGALEITTGNEQSLGANPVTFNAAQLRLNNGTLRVTGASLTLDDANRGIAVGLAGAGSGTFYVDTGLSLSVAQAVNANTSGVMTKAGAGTFNLTADAQINALVVDAGEYNQLSGETEIITTSTGLEVRSGAQYYLAGGELKTDKITVASGGTFKWGAGRLKSFSSNGNLGTTDYSGAGFHSVKTGFTSTVSGGLDTDTGSVLVMHGSPTLYLNSGVRFNNWAITGDVDLTSGGDAIEFELNPYLLRPFSSAGVGANETGSLPLLTWTGSFLGGTFDSVTGINLTQGGGFTEHTGGVITDPTALGINKWYIEYDAAAKTIWFHYKVAGYVPEPGSFGLMMVGAFGLRLMRRRR